VETGSSGRQAGGSDVRDLVLVGGGHAHVQVIRRWLMRPLPDVRLCVVLDRPEAVYSGMVPGFVAGDYEAHELEIDVVPLARRARARVVLAAATRIDPAARRIELEGRPPLAYDVASLDLGSSVRGRELPGVEEHALATRPIRSFVDRLEARLRAAAGGGPLRLALVGGGAAGIELAFTLEARLAAAGRGADITVVCDSADVLPGQPADMRRRARREAQRRGVRLVCGARAERVAKDALWLEGGERLPADLVVWAAGAAPPPALRDSPLPRDAAGFVRVTDTLQVLGQPDLFAVGDCASLEADPWVPKAGVYAVRQGPVLDANLRARLVGGRLSRYRPQKSFLALLNLGGRRALGARSGLAFEGALVWRLKDWIDRRFVDGFRVLDAAGAPASGFPGPASMGTQPMECGGCAAKLGAASLSRALERLGPGPADASVVLGLADADDAAAWRAAGGDVVLASVDGFRAFCDDPYLVGRVAAVNAASDVFAKGGHPRHALALVTLPAASQAQAQETLYQVLCGVRGALAPLGATLVGGHTTAGEELFVALSISGELAAGDALLPLTGARPGDRLVLTKALGTGVVLAADAQGLAAGAWLEAALASMLRPNAHAARVARALGAGACTDVTGFGLAGHLAGLLRASGVSARLRLEALPALAGAAALLARGVRSSFHAQNAAARGTLSFGARAAECPAAELVFDPQTSGGLLFALPAARAAEALAALREAGDAAAADIGEVTPPRPDAAVFALE
jgi:selenide,water dikinase